MRTISVHVSTFEAGGLLELLDQESITVRPDCPFSLVVDGAGRIAACVPGDDAGGPVGDLDCAVCAGTGREHSLVGVRLGDCVECAGTGRVPVSGPAV